MRMTKASIGPFFLMSKGNSVFASARSWASRIEKSKVLENSLRYSSPMNAGRPSDTTRGLRSRLWLTVIVESAFRKLRSQV